MEQEAAHRAEHRHRNDCGKQVSLEQGDHRQAGGGKRGDAARETVPAVDQVHRVDHADDPEHGDRDGGEAELQAAEQGQGDGIDAHPPGRDDGGGDDLQEQLGTGAQRHEVVEQADREDHRHAGGRGQQRRERFRQGDVQERHRGCSGAGPQGDGEENRESADARDQPGVQLPGIGDVVPLEVVGETRDQGRQHAVGGARYDNRRHHGND